MNLAKLILRELGHHRLNFSLGVVAVCSAVACLTAELSILHKHKVRDERIIKAKEEETDQRVRALEDDYRKITKGLGYNVLILPAEQDLNDLYVTDVANRYMPEEYVHRLATSRVATIQHLLPSLQQKVKWREADQTIILVGVRGEVPTLETEQKKPILEAVTPGTMTVGWSLHEQAPHLSEGARVTLLGREFTVGKVHAARSNKDDITVWINLREAQELLGRPGQINGVLALECVCAADSVPKVKAEIKRILPNTQVIFQSHALTRAEARQRARQEAMESMKQEKSNRDRLRQSRESSAAVLVPVVTLGAGIWIAFLSYGNVRDRRPEIGILRALGLRSTQIMGLFLSRALLMGVVGSVLGVLLGLLIGACRQGAAGDAAGGGLWLDAGFLVCVLTGAPLVAMLAGWLPAYLAAQEDPAEVLRDA
jgi:putative ABC transport system permease protein